MRILGIVSSFNWLLFIATASGLEVDPIEPQQQQPQTCTWEDDRETCRQEEVAGGAGATYQHQHRDKHLQPIEITLDSDHHCTDEEDGDGSTTFYAYVPPHIAYAYNSTPSSHIHPKETNFKGFFGKFINLSNKPVQVYWVPTNGRSQPTYIADLEPFGSAGTATYPGHHFIVCERKRIDKVLVDFHMVKGNSLYKYDPYGSIEAASQVLQSKEELDLYKLQYRNLAFNRVYEHKTGRQYLGLYGRNQPPRYPMWPADYFGQHLTVETKETHLIDLPPDEIAKTMVSSYGATPEQRSALQQYRDPNQSTLQLNMTVISVEPRAYEIQNFLSEDEVHHMMELATGMKLSRSTTKAGSSGTVNDNNDSTRTSRNSWIGRPRSVIVDSIFRRAADLLRIDEACFRDRKGNETHLVPGTSESISERLQLVHYEVGQQYTPHHDFFMPDLGDPQLARFATLLLYLNDVPKGGETSFPRWLNGETTEILKAKPEHGKAVLFYNKLPDGNYDERSQHAALPVIEGEKWLANLWVWDPYMN